jgi:hypothetical protein
MEHFGAVVGELRGFPRVQLGNHPRVRHDARIGGQEAGHVLPQGDPTRAQRPGQQRRREIGAAATQRREVALERGAQEAGHDRYDAARQQRRQHPSRRSIGARVVRRGMAEVPVGAHDLGGIHVLRPYPGGAERRGHEPRAEPLAARDDEIAGPRRELAEESETPDQRLQLRELRGDVREKRPAPTARGHDGAGGVAVRRPECRDPLGHGAVFPSLRVSGDGEQCVGGPGHRRYDDRGRLRAEALDDTNSVVDRVGVGQRSPAELVDVRGASRDGHIRGRIYCGAMKVQCAAGVVQCMPLVLASCFTSSPMTLFASTNSIHV